MKEQVKIENPNWLIISVAIIVFITLMVKPKGANFFMWLGETLTMLYR